MNPLQVSLDNVETRFKNLGKRHIENFSVANISTVKKTVTLRLRDEYDGSTVQYLLALNSSDKAQLRVTRLDHHGVLYTRRFEGVTVLGSEVSLTNSVSVNYPVYEVFCTYEEEFFEDADGNGL